MDIDVCTIFAVPAHYCGGYFVTEKDEAARNWEMFQEARALKAHLATMEDTARKLFASWGAVARQALSRRFLIEESYLRFANADRSHGDIDAVPWEHFDAEKLKRLLADIQETRVALEQKSQALKAHGLDL